MSEAGSNSVEYWAEVFREQHVKNVDGVIELGRRFDDCKESANEGTRDEAAKRAGYKKSAVSMICAVYQNLDSRFGNTKQLLPSGWDTLYRLTLLSDEQWESALREGVIQPTLTQAAAKKLRRDGDNEQELEDIAEDADDFDEEEIDIHHADALDILADIEPGSVDLLIADPPYNVTDDEWDQKGTRDEYLDWLDSVLIAIRPALNDQHHGFIFCDPEYQADIEGLVKKHFELRSRIVWVRKNMAQGRQIKDRFISAYEPVFHFGTTKLYLPDNWGDERFDVQKFAVPQTNFSDQKIHHTQKPLDLIRRFIVLGSPPGGLVFDPFCGGGTTAHAAKLEGRRCVTCDTNEQFVKLAKGRIARFAEEQAVCLG